MDKAYKHLENEDRIYQKWEKSGFFNPDSKKKRSKKSFSIAMPPPNATGVLHVGHASMLAYEDIMTRYHRMKGEDTLWIPGTDHASIATQTKVEKILQKEEGKTRQDLGREEFLKRVVAFAEDSKNTIRKQVRKMGSSCDWSRERYTLDAGLTEAVYELFVRMYEDDLIYRGNRIVHWCPRCASTLADDEVNYKEERTKFYYLKYGPVIIGTVRPETKFLDKTIVVHPEDERYKDLIGKTITVAWINGPIEATVIADPIIDKEFGTGAMTMTPAHSFEDFELAQKHHLDVVQIIDEQGNFTDVVGPEFAGKNAKESREKIVQIMQEKGLVDHIDEKYVHNISVCYRCDTPIEPLISKQWFINVNKEIPGRGKTLKQLTAEPVRSGEIQILPERFNKVYFQWIDNLRDWCISRQIWFGHRIPVWYCQDCDEVMVAKTSVEACRTCKSTNIKQDEDTLDTWFSSSLWTFSTLGWPNKTTDLKRFHPTAVMETGYDILFFWVARMVMMSQYALKEKPFSTVYLHGLVRDEKGRKMSKSLGNIIDPLELIEKYGADALRLTLIAGTMPGGDSKLSAAKVEGYRNFVNKLWNIARFIQEKGTQTAVEAKQTLADVWILQRLNETTTKVTEALDTFKFAQAIDTLYHFTWNDLADWYLEIAKIEGGKEVILQTILDQILKLWHPFVPFVTESIYEGMNSEMLMMQDWPKAIKVKKLKEDFDEVRQLIMDIRSIRSLFHVEPKEFLKAVIITDKPLIQNAQVIISKLARLSEISWEVQGSEGMVHFVSGKTELMISLGTVDVSKEIKRLQDELQTKEQYIVKTQAMLANPDYLAKAPANIQERQQALIQTAKEECEKIEKVLKSFV